MAILKAERSKHEMNVKTVTKLSLVLLIFSFLMTGCTESERESKFKCFS